jgi:hypothetical protein
MSGLKKLAFYEIGKGSLFREMQSVFEQAQITARDENGTVVVSLKIHVMPPEITDGRFGHIAYQIGVANPPRKSVKYTTELRDGLIINDGEDMADVLQTSLELPMIVSEKEGVING